MSNENTWKISQDGCTAKRANLWKTYYIHTWLPVSVHLTFRRHLPEAELKVNVCSDTLQIFANFKTNENAVYPIRTLAGYITFSIPTDRSSGKRELWPDFTVTGSKAVVEIAFKLVFHKFLNCFFYAKKTRQPTLCLIVFTVTHVLRIKRSLSRMLTLCVNKCFFPSCSYLCFKTSLDVQSFKSN